MRRRVIVLDEAEDELAEAEDWYEAQRPGLGPDFRRAIDEAMELLAEAPLAAQTVAHVPDSLGVRKLLVKRFPYGIVFMAHDEELWVLAFAHHSRRPGYWRVRMER
jgi:plasmid stabilization system protein ParE